MPLTGERPDGSEDLDDVDATIHSLSRSHYNVSGQVIHMDDYHLLDSLTYSLSSTLGAEGTNYYRTENKYDERGRLYQVTNAVGTITQTTFDVRGLPTEQWIGTSSGNLTKVSANVYDDNGNLITSTAYAGGGADARVSEYAYDWRNRLVATKSGSGTSPGSESDAVNRQVTYFELDNLGNQIASYTYDGDTVDIYADGDSDGVPDQPSSSRLRAKQTTEYDDQGRGFRAKTFSVDPTTGNVSTYALTTNVWYDKRGNVIKTSQPGGLVTKNVYDAAGRLTKTFSTDGGGDSAWGDADDVLGDTVLEQAEYQYDDNGNVLLVTLRQRFHDATGTGALGTPTSTTEPKARVSYSAGYYDAANRKTADLNVGTNGGSAYAYESTLPARSDTKLITSYTYDDAGRLWKLHDPRHIETRTQYDALGRTTATIEAYVDGIPSDDDDRITRYTYDGNHNVTSMTADLPSGQNDQTTVYTYGVTTSGGSALFSNDLLASVTYPDVNADGATGDVESFTYNALGETASKSDRNGSIHEYTYDVLGRLLSDEVTTLGTGVDGYVRKLGYTYNTQGLAWQFTSYDGSDDVVNQVTRQYNGLGQLIREYQEHNGAVTGGSHSVQYTYSEMGGGANHSRRTSMVYPDGRVLYRSYGTGSGLNDRVSRLEALVDDDGTTSLEAYSYLGAGTIVERAHDETGVDLTYIGSGSGDGGDQYVGLDRFGRIVDQRWTDGTADVDRFTYGYDRSGNRLYKENSLDSSKSELYHDGTGYDHLNRLTAFARGTLNGSKDAITGTPSRTQDWSLDALGNWNSLTTNGVAETRTHDDQNRLTDVGPTGLAFDNNGNLLTRPSSSGYSYRYDGWNRFVGVGAEPPLAGSTGHTYDALGRRLDTPMDSYWARLYYSDEWQVIEERSSWEDEVRVQHVWSAAYVNAMVLRDHSYGPEYPEFDQRHYMTHDANYNVTGVLRADATVQTRLVYDPYGSATTIGTLPLDWAYGYQGGRFDGMSGLYHFNIGGNGRDYSPTLGRWVQQDRHPSGPYVDGMNAYQYVRSAPVTLTDPTGQTSPVRPSIEGPTKPVDSCEFSFTGSFFGLHAKMLVKTDAGECFSVDGTGMAENGITIKKIPCRDMGRTVQAPANVCQCLLGQDETFEKYNAAALKIPYNAFGHNSAWSLQCYGDACGVKITGNFIGMGKNGCYDCPDIG